MSAPAPASAPFAEPTPLGLLGLSIGCAALLPIALNVPSALNASGLQTAAWFCLLFGAGGQLLAGLMSLANKNMLGGTLFTTFSFNWVMNWWALSSLAEGKAPNTSIVLSVDVTFLIIFVVMAYAFGHFSKLLFAFLFDIILLYVFRIAKELTHAPEFGTAIAVTTIALMAIALYIAFAMILNPTTGRALLPVPGPLFKPATPAPAPAPAAH